MNNLNLCKVKANGYFSISKIDKFGNLKNFGKTDNLILDGFFSFFSNGIAFDGSHWRVLVGTGQTPPTNTDTSLESLLVKSAFTPGTFPVEWDHPNNLVKLKVNVPVTFGVGAVVGNISEIGLEANTSSYEPNNTPVLCTRALIKDVNGVPTSITVLADEQLIVNYTAEFLISTLPITGTMILDSVNYDWELRWAKGVNLDSFLATGLMPNYPMAVPAINVTPVGSTVEVVGAGAAHISLTVEKQAGTIRTTVTANPNQGNIAGGIGGIVFGTVSRNVFFSTHYLRFPTKIPKNSDQKLTLVFDLTFERG